MAGENELAKDELMEEDTTKNRYLTFEIDHEVYGIEIANISEIISMKNIMKVPETPPYVEGIINLRGDIIPVIDVRKRFMKPTKEYDALTCIVVIEYEGYTLGLIVDEIHEVLYIEEENVIPPPNAKLNHYNQYIRNIAQVENSVKLLMDLDRFLAQD